MLDKYFHGRMILRLEKFDNSRDAKYNKHADGSCLRNLSVAFAVFLVRLQARAVFPMISRTLTSFLN